MDDSMLPESTPGPIRQWVEGQLSRYTLLDSLRGRRSRRFGAGMTIPAGPFTYQSKLPAQPLTELEEAALAFAAVGITGYSLDDLAYGKGQGGAMLGGTVGRTIASPDALTPVSLFVINDEATCYLKRPQNMTFDELTSLVSRAQAAHDSDQLLAIYRAMRVKVKEGRSAPPVEPGINFNINKWSLYAKGGTYFLPVNSLTEAIINALIEAFSPEMGLFVIDERSWFQPAGVGRFAKSKGGHLWDDPKDGRVVTVQGLEMSMAEAVSVEQGMLLHNLGLMSQALGLGGFANYARSEFAWFEALGFREEHISVLKYGGAPAFMIGIGALMGLDYQVRFPVGYEHNGETLLHAYCPPYYATMTEAVHAWVDYKFGRNGIFRTPGDDYWKDGARVDAQIEGPDPLAVEAAAAYCEYIYRRYGRFPAYSAPYRTVIGYQATHVDTAFYDHYFKPEALTASQRDHPLNAAR
jgi:hypothetical protein